MSVIFSRLVTETNWRSEHRSSVIHRSLGTQTTWRLEQRLSVIELFTEVWGHRRLGDLSIDRQLFTGLGIRSWWLV